MSTKPNKNKREVSAGLISLAQREGSLFKKALLCHVGSFKGLYGPVTITREILQAIADRHNRMRAKPKNENDFPPVLVDHVRLADNIKGRVPAGLYVGDWENPESGAVEAGLYGDLRIDRDQDKVENGQYSQVSITFDDETFDLFEVSFVAVEAATGSQVLSQGEDDMDIKQLQEQNTALSQRLETTLARATTARTGRKTICLALGQSLSAQEAEVTSLQKQVNDAILSVRSVALGAQFRGFVREGKLTKVELDALVPKLQEFAAMPAVALSAVIKSYADRKPSSDIVQHGQQGAKPVPSVAALSSPEAMREAIKQQQKLGKSKKAVALAEGDGSDESEEERKKREAAASASSASNEEGNASSEMGLSDVDGAIKQIESMSPMFEKLSASLKQMRESLSKLSEQDDSTNEGDAQ